MTRAPDDTCWSVLDLAARGDDAARERFTRDYVGSIRRFLALRWRGRPIAGEVDDALQEVFVECFKPHGVLARADPARGDFRGLLFAVTHNVARRFEERARAVGRIRPEDSAWIDGVASDEPSQSVLFDRAWARELVGLARVLQRRRAATGGVEAQRRVELLERRFGDDQAIRHIAADWGVPAQDVHNAYRKARAEFYACLKQVVGFHAVPGADVEAECRRLLELMDG